MSISPQLFLFVRRVAIIMTLMTGVLALNPDLILSSARAENAAPQAVIPGNNPPPPPRNDGAQGQCHQSDLAQALGINQQTAQAVQQILEQQRLKRQALDNEQEKIRAKHHAMRVEMEQKLAKMLTPTQIAQLFQLLPRPPRPAPPPAHVATTKPAIY